MPLGIDINDDRRGQIREWFDRYLGRGFQDGRLPDGSKLSAVDEQNLHLYVFATLGYDRCLAGILDSDEARKRRAA